MQQGWHNRIAAVSTAISSERTQSIGPLERRVLHGVHIAKEILWTLRSRPIGSGNGSYISDCLGSITRVHWELRDAVPSLPATWRDQMVRFIDCLGGVLTQPSPEGIAAVLSYGNRQLQPYCRVFKAPTREAPVRAGVLAGRRYRHVLLMTGPGLGIGDEIIFRPFFNGVTSHCGSAEAVEIFSFTPDIWRVMGHVGPVGTLVGDPMAAYRRIDALASGMSDVGDCLVVFANFGGQNMLPAFRPKEMGLDFLEVSIGKGQAWLRLRDDEEPATHTALDARHPHLSWALDDLLSHLFGRCRPSVPAARAKAAVADGPLRVLVNPFTSKINPLQPRHWGDLLRTVREAASNRRPLHARIHSGVTPECHRFATAVAAACNEPAVKRPGDAVTVLEASNGAPLTPENGIAETHRAIGSADFLLGMDTYTAHLAAQTPGGPPSVALCLNHNPQFWERAEATFWLNLEAGPVAIRTLLQGIVHLLYGADTVQTLSLREAAQRLLGHGAPDTLGQDPFAHTFGLYARWFRDARKVWNALPADVRAALERVDRDSAFPALRELLTSDDAASRSLALLKMANSNTFRIACLAARSRTGSLVQPAPPVERFSAIPAATH